MTFLHLAGTSGILQALMPALDKSNSINLRSPLSSPTPKKPVLVFFFLLFCFVFLFFCFYQKGVAWFFRATLTL